MMINQPLPTLSGQSGPRDDTGFTEWGNTQRWPMHRALGRLWSPRHSRPEATCSRCRSPILREIARKSARRYGSARRYRLRLQLTESSDSGAKGDNLAFKQSPWKDNKPQSTVVIHLRGRSTAPCR
ncbi:hypothetical protein J4727_18005 [Providencia rettgeri]|uniref:Uncharacterized protein n=1 Tax=Providencia rettgeri TaxID=587 RepID=A0A939SR48_PRORE|nr:hypothetical protein [Providencia rettgeri]